MKGEVGNKNQTLRREQGGLEEKKREGRRIETVRPRPSLLEPQTIESFGFEIKIQKTYVTQGCSKRESNL